jgi:hypothetical protein
VSAPATLGAGIGRGAAGAFTSLPARALRQARAWLRNLTGAEFTAFAAGSPALQEVARTQPPFAARYPSSEPYAAPLAWAPHVLIGTGGSPGRSAGGPRQGEAI